KAHDENETARSPFTVDTELRDVEALVARLRAQADDHALAAQFRTAAVKRLEEEGRDPGDEKALRMATGRERKLWLSAQLVQAGAARLPARLRRRQSLLCPPRRGAGRSLQAPALQEFRSGGVPQLDRFVSRAVPGLGRSL